MRFDEYGFINRENVSFPGNIGDSAAETGRYITLMKLLGLSYAVPKSLEQFLTDKGILRHPKSVWREDDTSGDQTVALLTAASLSEPDVADRIDKFVTDAGYRTGNGDLISPGLYAELRRHRNHRMLWMSDLATLGMALIMRYIPFRWSDSKETFESSEGSSADYLNFINALAYAEAKGNVTWPLKLAAKVISPDTAMRKVRDYFVNNENPEPNCTWMLEIYEKAIIKIWSDK